MQSGSLCTFGFFLSALSAVSAISAPSSPANEADHQLVSSETIRGLTIPPGTKAKVIADFKNQQVTSPTSLAFGSKGEIYIAETHRLNHGVADNRRHLYWYVDDISSRTTADRLKMHEKWQNQDKTTSLKFLTEKADLVRVLSDPDADGMFRKQNVFAGKFNDVLDGVASGVFEYEGTVFLACIPKIYALRDTDGNGEAEVRDVIQDGIGVHVSLSGHDLNGFILGADGRIYGTMGDRGMNFTTKEGRQYKLHDEGCVFRFDPDGSNFEVVHSGLRNPKEIAFDEFGNCISVDNNCDKGDEARVVYIVDGADSGWNMGHQGLLSFNKQIGMENAPPSKWMAESIWEMPNPEQPAYILPPVAHLTTGPAGLTYHPGTGFLESEAGRFLICDYRGGAAKSGVWSFKVEPSGAGMAMTDSYQLAWGSAATDVEYSWDGKMTVTDFIYGWESHDGGLVYTISADKPYRATEAAQVPILIKEGFEQRAVNNLAMLLFHPDMRIRVRAQLALSRRTEGLDMFSKAAAQTKNRLTRFHGVWGLGIIARRGAAVLPSATHPPVADPALREKARTALLGLLKDSDAEVRAQAIKALGESDLKADGIPFEKLIADSSSPRVQLFSAIAAGRMKVSGSIPTLLAMLEKTDDLYLRHAGSYALFLLETPGKIAALKENPSAKVRLAAVIALRRTRSPELAEFLTDSDRAVSKEAIRSINDQNIVEVRPQVGALLEHAPEQPHSTMIWQRMLHSAFRAGDEANARRVVKVALDQRTPSDTRTEAFRLLSEWTHPHPVDQSTGRIYPPLPARDPELIREVLGSSVTPLVQVDGKYLGAALALVQQNQLDLTTVTDDVLRALVLNDSVPGSARVEALHIYITRKPADLGEIITTLAYGGDDHLAIGALHHLVKSSPQAALEALAKTTSTGTTYRQQQAWKIAAEIPDTAPLIVSGLAALQKQNGISPTALELLDAAGKRSEPQVKAALAAFQSTRKSSTDPLAPWLPSLEGGDPEQGAKVFESHPSAQCLRCHAGGYVGGDAGGDAGPNLSDIGLRADRRHFLESLTIPGAKVAMGYGIASATLKGGKTVGGIVVNDRPDHVDFDSAGTVLRVKRADIASMTPPVSSMPPMADLLSAGEIRDVIAWLTEQKRKPQKKKPGPAPVLVTP